jgi:hypothetical protein
MSATLASVQTLATAALGGPYAVVPATGTPGQAYVLVPSTAISLGDPTGHLHIGASGSPKTLDELSAVLAAAGGTKPVPAVQPAAALTASTTDTVSG